MLGARTATLRQRDSLMGGGAPLTDKVNTDTVVLGPGTSISPESELTIPAENQTAIPAFQSGAGVIYLIGKVTYQDVFGNPRWLTFKMRSKRAEGNGWILEPTPDGEHAN